MRLAHLATLALLLMWGTNAISASAEPAKRLKLPFDAIEVAGELKLSGVKARFGADSGTWPPRVVFERPVHPEGGLQGLKIGGREVPLKSTALKDGMVTTRDFGDLEILVPAPGNVEIHGTKDQVDRIRKWLSSPPR